MRQSCGYLFESLVCRCRDISYKNVDLLSSYFIDKARLVITPVISHCLDLLRPPFEVAFIEKAQYIIQIQQPYLW